VVPDTTHYQRLGVAPDASAATIREAYRRLARQHHPDASAGDADSMSRINEAYRVLADPARRAVYDASLRGGSTRGGATGSAAPPSADPATTSDPLVPLRPAFEGVRIPWKLVFTVAALGVIGVLVLSQFAEAPPPPGPDGVIRAGECVTIDDAGFARDAPCTGDPAVDVVVVVLVPLDGTCPFATVAHQDRQGLGIACVRRAIDTPSS
jgi:molecular chaperone DnaJ